MVDRLKTEYEGRVEFRLLNAGTDQAAIDLGTQLGIQYVPTFVLVGSDGTINGSIVGAVAEADLRAAIDALR